MLLKKNVEINAADVKLGWTAVHIASIHNNIKIIKLLISNGADINKKDLQQKTALDYANEYYCVDAVNYLSKCINRETKLDNLTKT